VIAEGVDTPTIVGSNGLTTAAIVAPSQRFCAQETPLLARLKLFGVYQLPWQLQASASYQNVPGPMILATYVATNAQVQPSLGRPLSGRARNVTVHLIEPGTRYDDRLSQVDFRMTRTFHFGRFRLQAMMDLYNLLNSDAPISINTRYGPDWLVPQEILQARFVKFGAQLDF
jgi:hypothetical protein